MPKINLITLLLVLLCNNTYAAKPETPERNFEIYNKDDQPISVNVTVSGATISPEIKDFKVASKGNVQAQITVKDVGKAQIDLKITRGTQDYLFKVFLGDKKALMSFDSKKKPAKLYPETGKLKGLLGKTESGLSTKNNLSSASISEITAAKSPPETAKDELDGLPENIKKVAMQLRASSQKDAQSLYADVLSDEKFRDQINASTMPESTDALIKKLIALRTLRLVKEKFGVSFAGQWEKMVLDDRIQVEAWNAPDAKQLEQFAAAYEKELGNPFISSELIAKYLPAQLDEISKFDKFTRDPENRKVPVEPSLFASFLKAAPASSKLEDHLPEAFELAKYGTEFIKFPGYEARSIGVTMAAVLSELGDLSKSIKKGTVFGWNISDAFKNKFQQEAFKSFVREAGGLDFAQTQLLLNFYDAIKYPVSKGDLAYALEVGKFIKDKMSKGLSFTSINVMLRSNVRFDPKTSAEKAKTLQTSLGAIEINRAPMDGEKIFKMIRSRPLYVVGAVLEEFIRGLLPENEQAKATKITEGFRELDAHSSEFKAVGKMRKTLDDNHVLIVTLLPTALNDTAQAAQNLIQSALKTINAKIENPNSPAELKQLDDLVVWIQSQAIALKSGSEDNLFFEMPLTEKDQSSIRSGLSKIRLVGVLDTYVGKKIIEKVLSRSKALEEQLPKESKDKVSKLIAPIASTFAGAVPTIIKKFSVDKYLDFLLQVGKFKENQLTGAEFRKEIWKFLQVLVIDISKVSDTLPDAFDVIRDLGAENSQ